MHRIMELIDFSKEYDVDSLKLFIQEKVQEGMLSDIYAEAIRHEKVLTFLKTPLAQRMRKASEEGALYLEQPFVLGIPANRLKDELPEEEQILIQGIIDVFFIEDDHIVLMDYKTDVVNHPGQLIERYRLQLLYYAEALERVMGKKVTEMLIYSFYLDKEIYVK